MLEFDFSGLLFGLFEWFATVLATVHPKAPPPPDITIIVSTQYTLLQENEQTFMKRVKLFFSQRVCLCVSDDIGCD